MEWGQIGQFLLGGAMLSFISTLVTLQATRKKANAAAKSNELDNVQEAVKIWRETAECFKAQFEAAKADNCEITKQIDALRKEVAKLTTATTRVLKLLDKITPDNLESTITEIRNEIHDRTA